MYASDITMYVHMGRYQCKAFACCMIIINAVCMYVLINAIQTNVVIRAKSTIIEFHLLPQLIASYVQ